MQQLDEGIHRRNMVSISESRDLILQSWLCMVRGNVLCVCSPGND